ncbi:MAG: monovalent cation/H+ antiporter subunit D family protein [Deltaproteobacteria bacterium]|nr:monovalent cation/H+ antiporter subunit D family protein [Deltaproteobacteria bacterium]
MIQPAAPLWIIVALFVGALALPLVRRLSARAVLPTALLFSTLAVAASLRTAHLVFALTEAGEGALSHHLGGWPPPWGIELRVDNLSAVMVLLVNLLSWLVLLFSHRGLPERLKSRAHFFYSLYLLFTMGMSGFVMTGDLFNLYVFLEVIALTGYALVAVGDPEAPFAAFRYVIIGTLGAAFYLLGLAYLYGLTGSLNFVDVARQVALLEGPEAQRALLVALAFLVTGFGIKAALFPLHAWLPDAYAYSPNVTTALMGAVGIKMGAYGIFRVLYTLYRVGPAGDYSAVLDLMGWLSALAIIIGSLLAIAQTDLKRMLAYSSVSQIGYVLLGFSLANDDGLTGGVLHMINHAVMKCALFMVTGAIVTRLGHRDIRRFDGLGRHLPFTMAAFGVASLSMVGIPPTAGFFSKWYLVLGAVEGGRWPFVIIILASSLLNAIYFFRILERAFFKERVDPTPTEAWVSKIKPLPGTMLLPVGVATLAILILGLGSFPIVEHVIGPIVRPALGLILP